ncbi:hypothetical protein JXJ21_20830 [candidate division KSB1 bacterium]|nr:hypothetical protein [candidate division KSB1 bacterium]
MKTLKQRLQSDFIDTLYTRTYYSLLDRVDPDGFLQESLTGRYSGMFPRTVGAAVALFLETGELDTAERIINCTLEAMTVNEMERIPHVFFRQTNDLIPVFNDNVLMQALTPVGALTLGDGTGAALQFIAPELPILTVEAAIELNACKGKLTLRIQKTKDGDAIQTVVLDAKHVFPGQTWQRFELPEPLTLEQGQAYFIRFDYDGFGSPIWRGRDRYEDQACFELQASGASEPPRWIQREDVAPAYAIDLGKLRHEPKNDPYKIYCDWDQIDGQAHVIMAWAQLACRRGPTDFEDRTYRLMIQLMNRTSDQPYFLWGRGHKISVNLVQNICLEHSREDRYWYTWDLLTQCVVGSALKSMIEVAIRRNDFKHAQRWQDRLQVLKKGIAQNLTRELNGKTVYLEMRIPNAAGGVPFTGMSWVNFAPIMAQWEPLERQVLRNTIEALQDKLIVDYQGYKYMAIECDEQGTIRDNLIIGKGIGWEIEFARQEKEFKRIFEWLDFLEAFHTGKFLSEGMFFDGEKWTTGDGGNGEQSCWWCWAMARLRKEAGLPATEPA